MEHFAETYLASVNVLVNAAGMALATSNELSPLLGANAILPLFLARAAAVAGVSRFVHVSSAAVQGRGRLDESDRLDPDNHYALSKALGELLPRTEAQVETVVYRPTSVQGPNRPVTRQLMRLGGVTLRRRSSTGRRPQPRQIPVQRVGEAVRLLVGSTTPLPGVVLHPWEGATTRSVMTDLGGKEPRTANRRAAERAVAAAYAVGRNLGGQRANARRLELLLFGQVQTDLGWLSPRLPPVHPGWMRQCRREALTKDEPNLEGQHLEPE